MEQTTRPAAEQKASRERLLTAAMTALNGNLETSPLGAHYVFNGIKSLASEAIIALEADPESKLVLQAVELRQKIGKSSINLASIDEAHKEAASVSDEIFTHFDAESDTRFLFAQQLLVMNLTDDVPATTLYDYWGSFKPTSTEGKEFHEEISRILEKLEPKTWEFEAHADANLSFWEKITGSVGKVADGDSAESLADQTIKYVRDRANRLRSYLMTTSRTGWTKEALERVNKLLIGLRDKPDTLSSAAQA